MYPDYSRSGLPMTTPPPVRAFTPTALGGSLSSTTATTSTGTTPTAFTAYGAPQFAVPGTGHGYSVQPFAGSPQVLPFNQPAFDGDGGLTETQQRAAEGALPSGLAGGEMNPGGVPQGGNHLDPCPDAMRAFVVTSFEAAKMLLLAPVHPQERLARFGPFRTACHDLVNRAWGKMSPDLANWIHAEAQAVYQNEAQVVASQADTAIAPYDTGFEPWGLQAMNGALGAMPVLGKFLQFSFTQPAQDGCIYTPVPPVLRRQECEVLSPVSSAYPWPIQSHVAGKSLQAQEPMSQRSLPLHSPPQQSLSMHGPRPKDPEGGRAASTRKRHRDGTEVVPRDKGPVLACVTTEKRTHVPVAMLAGLVAAWQTLKLQGTMDVVAFATLLQSGTHIRSYAERNSIGMHLVEVLKILCERWHAGTLQLDEAAYKRCLQACTAKLGRLARSYNHRFSDSDASMPGNALPDCTDKAGKAVKLCKESDQVRAYLYWSFGRSRAFFMRFMECYIADPTQDSYLVVPQRVSDVLKWHFNDTVQFEFSERELLCLATVRFPPQDATSASFADLIGEVARQLAELPALPDFTPGILPSPDPQGSSATTTTAATATVPPAPARQGQYSDPTDQLLEYVDDEL